LLFGQGAYQTLAKPLPTCFHCIESNHFGAYINEGLKKGDSFNQYLWYTKFEYYPNQRFYVEKLSRNHSQTLTYKIPSEWQSGDRLLLLQPDLLESIPTHLTIKQRQEKFSISEIELG